MAIQQRTGDAKVKGVADIVFVFDCTDSITLQIMNEFCTLEDIERLHQECMTQHVQLFMLFQIEPVYKQLHKS